MRTTLTRLLVGLLFVAPASQLYAGPAGIPQTGDIPRAEPPKVLPSVKPAEIKQREKPAYQPKQSDVALNIRIKTFTFSGNVSLSSETLNNLLSDFIDREIGINDLNQASKRITNFYRKQGYFLAQAYLPTQDITGDSVQIAVIEGSLGQLNVVADDVLDQSYLQSAGGYQLNKGGTVSEHNLVRNVTILNALPGLDATAQLNPSETVGSTDVEISIEPLPTFEGYLGANTYGNPFTKREVLIAGASWHNPAGRGDRVSLNLKRSRNNGQRGLDLGYIVPIHASGTLLNLRYNYIDYQLGGTFKALGAQGDSQYVDIGIDQPIIRDATKGITLSVASSFKEVNDELKTTGLENRRNLVSLDMGLVADWLNAKGNVSYQLGTNVRTGRVIFKDELAKIIDETGADTAGGFVKYSLSANRIQYFADGLSWALRANYQRAGKNLDTVEKMSIGGINSWRQFAELPSLADSGFVIGTDIRKQIAASEGLAKWLVNITPYTFIDVGRGKLNQQALSADNHVKSIHAGIGFDANLKNDWLFSVTASHQNRDFTGVDAENELRFWGQLIKFF